MRTYDKTFTSIKELRFLSLIAIKEITEDKARKTLIPLPEIKKKLGKNLDLLSKEEGLDVRISLSKLERQLKSFSRSYIAAEANKCSFTIHDVADKLKENKEIWDGFNVEASFEDKLSEALTSLGPLYSPQTEEAPDLGSSKTSKKSAVYWVKADGVWYRGAAFKSSLKEVATELAESLDLNTGVPIEVKEPEYEEKIKIGKKAVMTYRDFQKLAAIVNEDIYKIIGRTSFEQAAWLRGVLGME